MQVIVTFFQSQWKTQALLKCFDVFFQMQNMHRRFENKWKELQKNYVKS